MKKKKVKVYSRADFKQHLFAEKKVKKRRFVCTHGEFNKFWNCWVEGNTFYSEWGPIGGWQRTKVRSFYSEAAARKHMEKEIRRKTKQKEPGNSHGTYKEVFNLTKNKIKHILANWLNNNGWKVDTHWRNSKEPDLFATKNNKNWMIEVIGFSTKRRTRIRNFNQGLGEILQRMDDSKAKYSIALSYQKQYRNLWQSLPKTIKNKMRITALFIDTFGDVEELT